jgi:hypothetical protein
MSNFFVIFHILLLLLLYHLQVLFFFTFFRLSWKKFHFFGYFVFFCGAQSFNNLNYRPDPVVVLGEEHQHNQNRRHPDTSVQFQSSRRYPDDGGHRYKSQHQQQQRGPDARPYASTNLIHQIGVESAELRDRSGSEENQQPQQQPRGPSIAPAGPLESAPPPPAATSAAAAQSRRQMRYFGDTDLESQPSRGGGYSSRYMPKAKVLRSASSAAGMGAVRR